MRKITFRVFCGMTFILLGFAAQAQYCVVTGGGNTASPADFTLRNIADVTTTGGTTNIDYAGSNGSNGSNTERVRRAAEIERQQNFRKRHNQSHPPIGKDGQHMIMI